MEALAEIQEQQPITTVDPVELAKQESQILSERLREFEKRKTRLGVRCKALSKQLARSIALGKSDGEIKVLRARLRDQKNELAELDDVVSELRENLLPESQRLVYQTLSQVHREPLAVLADEIKSQAITLLESFKKTLEDLTTLETTADTFFRHTAECLASCRRASRMAGQDGEDSVTDLEDRLPALPIRIRPEDRFVCFVNIFAKEFLLARGHRGSVQGILNQILRDEPGLRNGNYNAEANDSERTDEQTNEDDAEDDEEMDTDTESEEEELWS